VCHTPLISNFLITRNFATASKCDVTIHTDERELLAIVFGCTHFEAYIYGRDIAHVETEHKPLEVIVAQQCTQVSTENATVTAE